MKKTIIIVLTAALIVSALAVLSFTSLAADLPFNNLFREGFGGYTSDEGEILTDDFVSSKKISVSEGETIWFGPCEPAQYFQLVGLDASGSTATDKVRGKELEMGDIFANGNVIYSYTVPAGISDVVLSVPASLKSVYTVSKTEISELIWRAFWNQQGVSTDEYVGQSSYYTVTAGDKLYFGAITLDSALGSVLYDADGTAIGTMAQSDLRLVESFGGAFGVYCYTVPEGVAYTRVSYDSAYEQYYSCIQLGADQTVADAEIVSGFITEWGIPLPLESTVKALAGKTALFLGDSITYGARDRANIYEYGSWAGRIGYYAGMDVTNNGVSGACISTARRESNSEAHYIYNNLVKTQGTTYDYVIMHGLFNDASEGVELGTMQGKAGFDPAKADVTTYAGGLELLFYQARVQNPNAILGFIVNFQTERTVDQLPYVNMAIAICENWGIEYLDLYNRPGFSVEFDDGLHPSSAGYDSMYTIVANWMAGLDGSLDSTEQTFTSSADVMSYNVFWNTEKRDGELYGSIDNRTDKVLALIGEKDPDILMLQEVSPSWMTELAKLSGYSHYGYSHKKGVSVDAMTGNDEAAPIYWKTDKYSLVDSGYMLTVDNGIVSDYPRAINWVILQDKTSGGKLLVMNYHADPNDETARNLTARLIVDELDAIRSANGDLAAVIGGDWNMAANSTAYATVTGNGLSDIRYNAAATESVGSFTNWNRTDESKYALGDYVFMAGVVGADSFDVITDDWADEGKTLHISDHCPILVSINY